LFFLTIYRKLTPLKMQTNVPKFTKSEAFLPTRYGNFTVIVYHDEKGQDHLVLSKNLDTENIVLVRIHSSCETGDVFGSLRCDCGPQLDHAMKKIAENDSGVLVYLNQEGRGIGLFNKIKTYALQDEGLDTVEANEKLGFPADLRDYHLAASILTDLGITKIKLITNNPDKEAQLVHYAIDVVERIPLEIEPNKYNKKYLETKKQKLHHKLTLV